MGRIESTAGPPEASLSNMPSSPSRAGAGRSAAGDREQGAPPAASRREGRDGAGRDDRGGDRPSYPPRDRGPQDARGFEPRGDRPYQPRPQFDRTPDEAAYPIVLVADRNAFQLHLYEGLELSRSYTVAVGALGFDTPAGLYHIQNKAVDPAWSVPNSDWAGDLGRR